MTLKLIENYIFGMKRHEYVKIMQSLRQHYNGWLNIMLQNLVVDFIAWHDTTSCDKSTFQQKQKPFLFGLKPASDIFCTVSYLIIEHIYELNVH